MVLADQVKQYIVNKVKESMVVADEVTDVSNKEQLSIVLSYVDCATLMILSVFSNVIQEFLTLRHISLMYPNVSTLVKILCTLPVTTCSAERSFSSMKWNKPLSAQQ